MPRVEVCRVLSGYLTFSLGEHFFLPRLCVGTLGHVTRVAIGGGGGGCLDRSICLCDEVASIRAGVIGSQPASHRHTDKEGRVLDLKKAIRCWSGT